MRDSLSTVVVDDCSRQGEMPIDLTRPDACPIFCLDWVTAAFKE